MFFSQAKGWVDKLGLAEVAFGANVIWPRFCRGCYQMWRWTLVFWRQSMPGKMGWHVMTEEHLRLK